MATQNEYGRLIAAAAKAALEPIGCFRRGQSRVWLSDELYWAIMIEFQPSGFTKGSYLNVGASWLWYEKKTAGLNFNTGYRVDDIGFIPFENKEQFHQRIEIMAARAAREVLAIRTKFLSIDAISRCLNSGRNESVWDLYHAAVSAGLNGDLCSARSTFESLSALPIKFDWELEVHAESAKLAAALSELAGFRNAVAEIVSRRRQGAYLPAIHDCFSTLSLTSSARDPL